MNECVRTLLYCLADCNSANVISSQQDRQGTYKRNNEERSRNHCCRGKSKIITYSDRVFVAFIIQNTMRMRRTILSPVWLYNIFHTINGKIFEKKKIYKYIEQKMRFLIFSTTLVLHISHSKKNSARCYHICALVFMLSTRYSCQILIKFEFSQQIFVKYRNIKFHEYTSSESRVVSCEQQTDMTKLRVVFAILRTLLKK